MVKVGNLEQLGCASMMLNDGVTGAFEVSMGGADDVLQISVTFNKSDDEINSASWAWDASEAKVSFTLKGWKWAMASGMPDPQKFGGYKNDSLYFQVAHWHVAGKAHVVQLFILRGTAHGA